MILAELKALANEKRLRIIYALSLQEFCQLHIIEITELSQVDTSRNLKVLVDSGLVNSEKRGNRVIYSLSAKIKEDYAAQLDKIKMQYNYLTFDVDVEEIIDDCNKLGEGNE